MGVPLNVLGKADMVLTYATPSWITSLMTFAQKHSIQIHLPDLKSPPLTREHDCYLMDELANFYNKKQLMYLNQCRMRLKVITLTDIIQYDGVTIKSRIWNGTGPVASNLTWPKQGDPGKMKWALWRQGLTQCFTIENQQLLTPLGMWNGAQGHIQFQAYATQDMNTIRTHSNNETTYWARSNLGKRLCHRNNSMKHTMEKVFPIKIKYKAALCSVTSALIPPIQPQPIYETKLDKYLGTLGKNLRKILGRVTLPQDDGIEIATCMANGTLLGGSDGSVKHGHGSYAYKLQASTMENSLGGMGKCSKTYEQCYSLFAENQGALTVSICIEMICNVHKISGGNYKVVIDNQEVTDRLEPETKKINRKSWLVPNYDTTKQLKHICSRSSTKGEWSWIKGHQDIITEETKINNEVDCEAKKAHDQCPCPDSHIIFPNGGPTLTINGKSVAGDITYSIIHAATGPQYKSYLKRKHS